jgi:glycosyltransferase involved in cell wall biosynthesis
MSKNNFPLVSFAIPSYNHEKYIGEMLDSCIAQTYPNIEVVVVDDASTDNSRQVIEDYVQRYPAIIRAEFNATNLGQALTARNALRLTRGEYLAGIGSDDVSLPHRIAAGMEILMTNPALGAVFSKAEIIDETSRTINSPIASVFNCEYDDIRWRLLAGNFLCGPSILVRSNLLRKVLPNPNLRYVEDFDLSLRILDTHELLRVDDVWVKYRSHGKNLSIHTADNIPFAGNYETAICILSALNRWPIEKLFSFKSLSGTSAHKKELALAHCTVARHCIQMDDTYFGQPFLFTSEAYRQLLIATESDPNNDQALELLSEVWGRLGDHSRALGKKPITFVEWKSQQEDFAVSSNKRPRLGFQRTPETVEISQGRHYQQWLSRRTMIAEEIQAIEEEVLQTTPYTFHLFMRLAHGQDSALADTIDSLGGQFYPNWHLDIITDLVAPEGLSDIPCIGWHNAKIVEQKSVIDGLINQNKYDWCIEIPAGAKLDPLYLWRLSTEIVKNPETRCFFVDDDCFDNTNKSIAPRFKPGCNPSALESSDLAGPIFIARDTWNTIGGASESNASPWFIQLLRVARHFGWDSIQHIPDVLISYPEIFPSDVQSCLFALLEHLNYEKTKTEIVPTTGTSWGFRYQLTPPPKVSIAILSKGRLELLSRCIDSIIEKTIYPTNCLEVLIVLNHNDEDLDMSSWLSNTTKHYDLPIKTIRTPSGANKATQSNTAVQSASGEFTLLLDEEVVIIESGWLNDLVGTCAQSGIAGTTPCLIGPTDNTIQQAGLVLGMESISIPFTSTQPGCILETNNVMQGIAGPLYGRIAMYDHTGYLSSIKMPRDVSVLSGICMLVRTQAYLEVNGMDDDILGNTLADLDLSLKLRQKAWRLIYQPLATVRFGDVTDFQIPAEEIQQAEETLKQKKSRETFKQRWWPKAAVDPLWSPNLSLSLPNPTPATNHLATWQYLPLDIPKILAYPMDAGQGIIRINQPVEALRKAGLAQVFLHPQQPNTTPITPAELMRLAPDTVVLHHFFNNIRLPELQSWNAAPGRPFLVFAMDDLITALDNTNPFKSNIQPDIRSRLKKALACCDRLVVSTDYLGNTCTNLISDILVVPNFIEQSVWLPLRNQRRTSSKPRIGWGRWHIPPRRSCLTQGNH